MFASRSSCSSHDSSGPGERELLDLVELVDADHPARVAAGGAGLAAEAGREGGVAERQLVGVEDLARVQARERDLRRARQVEAVLGHLVDVGVVRRERSGADQRLLADEHGRQHRRESLLRRGGRARTGRARTRAAPCRRSSSRSGRPTSAPRAPCRSGRPRRARAPRRPGPGSPTRRTSRTSSSVEPSGVSACGQVRHAEREPVALALGRGVSPPRRRAAAPSPAAAPRAARARACPSASSSRAARRASARARASARRPRAARRTPRRRPCARAPRGRRRDRCGRP